MSKRGLTGILLALCVAVPLPGRALTTIASCSGNAIRPAGPTQCTATFLSSVYPVNLRPTPDVLFAGTLDVRVTRGTVTHSLRTTWLSGRIQVSGAQHLTVLLEPYTSWTLLVVAQPTPTSPGIGQYGGVVEA